MAKLNLAKNTSYITAALTIQKVLSFIYFWFISNNLFPGQLGQYVFALSFTALFSIFIDLGLSPVLTREASKNEQNANNLLRNILALKIPLGILAVAAAWFFINLSGKSADMRMLVYISSFITLLDSFSLSFWVIFRSRHTLKYESIATVLVQVVIFTLGIIALKTTGQVVHLILALLVASVFNFLLSLSLLKIKLKFRLTPRWDKSTIHQLLRFLPAFALGGIFLKIYNSTDSILLSFLVSDEAVGYYAIPAKVITSLQQVIPGAFAAVIFPAFSYHASSPERLAKIFSRATDYLIILSLPLTAGLLVLLPEIIRVIWPAYGIVIPNFAVMTLAIPFIFLAFPTGYLLNATNNQAKNTINRGVVTGLALILNLLLIPKLSFLGAGITFLITNILILIADLWWTARVVKIPIKKLSITLGKSLISVVAMVIVLLFLRSSVNLIVSVISGIIIYFLVMHVIKGVNLKELKSIRNQA